MENKNDDLPLPISPITIANVPAFISRLISFKTFTYWGCYEFVSFDLLLSSTVRRDSVNTDYDKEILLSDVY